MIEPQNPQPASENNSAEGNEPSLGLYLRQQRELRGITIEQLASATKINVRILQSLEDDQFKDLPAKPFIRGFVTSYARFIGLDPKELLLRFDDFISRRTLERPVRDAGHSGYAFDRKDSEQSRTVLWIVMGSFMFVGGVLWLVLKPNLHHKRSAHVEKLKSAQPAPVESQKAPEVLEAAPLPNPSPLETVVPSTSLSPTPSPTSTVVSEEKPVALASPTAQAESAPAAILATPSPEDPLASGVGLKGEQIKYKLLLKAQADVWVRYQSDDRPKMQFVLRKDKVLVLRAGSRLLLQVSNPAAISGRINGGKETALTEWKTSGGAGGVRYLFGSMSAVPGADPFESDKNLPKTPGPQASDATN